MDKSEIANKYGISKTVYSLVYRDTEEIERACRDSMPRDLYGEPWTGKQDAVHEDFFATSAVDRLEAGRMHMKWIVARCINVSSSTFDLDSYMKFIASKGATGIPFKHLAEKFALLGAKNKEKFGNHLLS